MARRRQRLSCILRPACRCALAGALLAGGMAHAALVIIVNPANPLGAMTPDQAAQYFLGRSNSLTPFDLAGQSSLRTEFYQKLTGKDQDQVKAIWSKIVFTGRGLPPREYGTSGAIRHAVAADRNAIGYIDSSVVDGTVKVVLTLP